MAGNLILKSSIYIIAPFRAFVNRTFAGGRKMYVFRDSLRREMISPFFGKTAENLINILTQKGDNAIIVLKN
jgi:hypothetical protein